jgi:4-amino-4-deoxy-L-arabinose transferase-like glycosyltransferase
MKMPLHTDTIVQQAPIDRPRTVPVTNISPQSKLSAFLSRRTAWMFALIAFFYIGTIGTLPLLGKDEPRYVQIAREMWQRGDWVTPMLGGQTWFEKPATLYWMIIANFHVFGVSEWAARLGPALCGLATVALVYWIAWRVEQKSALESQSHARGLATWSAVALASCAGLIAFSHVATFDIVLTQQSPLRSRVSSWLK